MDIAQLKKDVEAGATIRSLAKKFNKSPTSIRYWMNKSGIEPYIKEFKCWGCGDENPNNAVIKSATHKSKSSCKTCHSKYTNDRFKTYKLAAIEYKGGRCIKCGYSKCSAALHFHHRDPNEKDPSWKTMKNRTLDKIKVELDKCDLVCGNCHAEIHEEWAGHKDGALSCTQS